MADNKNTSNGIGLGTILCLIFLTLKLGGWGVVATWSWWWVFSPIWIPTSVQRCSTKRSFNKQKLFIWMFF